MPVAPAGATPPVIESFTATVTDTNLITLSWQVSGGDGSNLVYILDDVGFQPQDCTPGPENGCSHSFRAKRTGVHRFTLGAGSEAGGMATAIEEAVVAILEPPTVSARRVHVDMLDKQDQTLTWSHPGPNDPDHHFVQITKAGSMFPIGAGFDGLPGTKFPLAGSYTVPASSFPEVGEADWSLRYCIQPDLTKPAVCSSPTTVAYVVEPAQLDGDARRFLPSNQSVELTWSGSGNQWFVSAPSLGISQWTATPNLTIPAANVTAGRHTVQLTSCRWGVGCSNRRDVKAPKAGTVHHVVANASYNFPDPTAAVLTPDDGTGDIPLDVAPGQYFHAVSEGSHVDAGALIGYVITQDNDKVELVVDGGSSVPTFTYEEVDDAFAVDQYDLTTRPSTGAGLDITFDSSGDVWALGEFHTGIAHIDDGVLTDHPAPRNWLLNPTTSRFEPTKPFRSNFGNALTSLSGGGESVIDTGTSVWWAQAGSASGPDNHSRLIRFDRTGTDDPATPDDDRICAVHVPGDHNQVFGLAYDAALDRVWFTEVAYGDRPSSVSWFDEGSLPCNNDLQYQQWVQDGQGYDEVQNDAAIDAAADANLCDEQQTTGCIHRIPLPSGAGAPSHIAVDAAGGHLWVIGYTGQALSRLPLDGGTTASVEVFPLPVPVRPGWFGGFPWQIRVDGSAVYVNEYGDNQLMRFDKSVPDPTAACGALVGGANPCIDEIDLPMAGNHVNAHSIALRDGKLWFTMSAERVGADGGDDASYFGFVDTASWAAGTPTGTIYTLSSLGPPPERGHWAVRGIEVSPTGKVALAETGKAALVLTPL